MWKARSHYEYIPQGVCQKKTKGQSSRPGGVDDRTAVKSQLSVIGLGNTLRLPYDNFTALRKDIQVMFKRADFNGQTSTGRLQQADFNGQTSTGRLQRADFNGPTLRWLYPGNTTIPIKPPNPKVIPEDIRDNPLRIDSTLTI
ncbi:hypothetical protein H2202_000013 [Exophiala xenobiotica]|nr:hypothetical protein H2202_000013 [Exophiala xenobiotica]